MTYDEAVSEHEKLLKLNLSPEERFKREMDIISSKLSTDLQKEIDKEILNKLKEENGNANV